MSKPTKDFDWATDATISDPGEAWDGDATKVEPPAGVQSQGYHPEDKVPAKFLNWMFNLIGQWVSFLDDHSDSNDDWVYPSAITRTLALASMNYWQSSDDSSGAAHWYREDVGGGVTNVTYLSRSLQEEIVCDLHQMLPTGAVLKRVEVNVTPGAPRSLGDRVELEVYGSTGLLGSDTDDGTTNLQSLTVSGLSETVDRTSGGDKLFARVTSGGTAGADRLEAWFSVTFDDPGPRNY